MGATGPFVGGKVTSMNLLTPSCAQLQNMWTHTICSPYAFNVPTGTDLPLCVILDFYEHSDRKFFSIFFFFHVRAVHLDIMKVLFIHQLMH